VTLKEFTEDEFRRWTDKLFQTRDTWEEKECLPNLHNSRAIKQVVNGRMDST